MHCTVEATERHAALHRISATAALLVYGLVQQKCKHNELLSTSFLVCHIRPNMNPKQMQHFPSVTYSWWLYFGLLVIWRSQTTTIQCRHSITIVGGTVNFCIKQEVKVIW